MRPVPLVPIRAMLQAPMEASLLKPEPALPFPLYPLRMHKCNASPGAWSACDQYVTDGVADLPCLTSGDDHLEAASMDLAIN